MMNVHRLSYSLILSFTLALVLTACSNRAKQLGGSWLGPPTAIADYPVALDALPVFDFVYQSGDSGTVNLRAILSAELTYNLADTTCQPASVSIAALADISGEYTLKDNKLDIHYNPSSLSITVDPEAMYVRVSGVDATTLPYYDSIRQTSADSLRLLLPSLMMQSIATDTIFTDLTITDEITQMTSQVTAGRMVLRKQSEK